MSDKTTHRRAFTAPLEVVGRTVEGCCVPYGQASEVADGDGPSYWEVFEAGAFRRQRSAPNRLELRYEHRDGLADSVGVCRELDEQDSGLYGSFQIHAGAFGDQALELVRSGVLPGFSIGFRDRLSRPRRLEDGTIVRASCVLDEVSLVRSPAFAAAKVLAIRSRRDWEAELDLPPANPALDERLRALGYVN